jgi:hypothetical protein
MKSIFNYLLPSLLVAAHAFSPNAARADDPADSCTQLTPAAISALIETLEVSVLQATADCDSFCEGGAYDVAARANLEHLTDVLDRVVELQSWLEENELDTPYVTNSSASFGIHGVAREAVYLLHHARHWATISAVHHSSEAARLSVDTTTQAIHQLDALGEQGALCYLAGYGPYTN